MEYRPYYFAREWSRQGHNVTIVASSQSHLRTGALSVQGSLAEEQIDGIRYVWLRGPSYQGNGLGRVMNIFSFLMRLELENKRVVGAKPPDVVIASSTYTLDIAPARRIASKFRAKLIYEVHDLWPLSPMELGNMSRWHPFIMLVQWAENYACRRADRVVSLLPKAEPHLRQHGMLDGKFAYIPNGIDVDEWQNNKTPIPEEHRKVLTSLKQTGSFLIGYAGSHGVANALHTVVNAALLLRDHPVFFVLVGQGPEKETFQRLVRERALKNILFLPPVPKWCIPSLLTSFDALYIGLARKPIYRFGVSPNKLIDYMMSGRPVLQGLDGGNDLVAASKCGISMAPEDAQALTDAALRMMSWTPSQRVEAGMRGRDYILRNHDYRTLACQFVEVMGSGRQSRVE
jgi:glycosyltransferase involved in cell wall biosynthesis